MKRIDNKGFTLVELMATIIILAIIMGIGGYSITAVMKNAKKKDYQLLVGEIKNSVEGYYQECKYVNNDCEEEITLGFLVTNGYLKGNSVDTNDEMTLMNPIDSVDIASCTIKYKYENGKMIVEAVSVGNSCPTTEDYNNN